MGNSSSKDNDNSTNTNKKPTGKSVLKFDLGAPANTNVFLIYTDITTEYLIKVLSSVNFLSRTSNYTLIIPGFQLTPTSNKTRFSVYTYKMATNAISKTAETIDKIDIPDFQATITKTNEKCTILTDLPKVVIDENENLMSFSRDINNSTMPLINIFVGVPSKTTDKIVDCYIKDWSTFEMDQPSDLIGVLIKSKLFQEDSAALPMYTFSIEKLNINKIYKDNSYYFILPKNLSLYNLVRHVATVGLMKNTCTSYILSYYSGQMKIVMDAFLTFYKSQYNFNYFSFYIETPSTKAQKLKCISINATKCNGNIITFNKYTIDAWDYGTDIPSTATQFYNNNFIVKSKSAIYGKQWRTNYTISDPPTEIFSTQDTVTTNPSMSFIYYHLSCGDADFYMVPQMINDATERVRQDPNYKGMAEKFTLLFTHNNYDGDSVFKKAVDSINFLKIVPLSNKQYILTNITNETSILDNYYFTVSINNKGDKYKFSVNITDMGKVSSFVIPEESKTNFIEKNPITTNKGLFFPKQIVQVPEEIVNDTNNMYALIFKDPVEATLWNFCRQCSYKNMWSNFIILTNIDLVNVIPSFNLLSMNDIRCIVPESITNVTTRSVVSGKDNLNIEFSNYVVTFALEYYDNNFTNPNEMIGISFKFTRAPWSVVNDIPIGFQKNENSYNILLKDNIQFTGAPIGALTFSLNKEYVDKLEIPGKGVLLQNENLFYMIINDIKSDLAKAYIEFAEKEFEKNSKVSKLNLLLNLDRSVTMDFSNIIKIGQQFAGTKQILYLYDKTTIKDDTATNLCLTTPEYADFEYMINDNEIKPVDDLLKLMKPDNSVVINKIGKKYSMYSVFRKDIYYISQFLTLTLQQPNQIQFIMTKFENDKTIINMNTRNTQHVLSFDITKKSSVLISCIKGNFLEISTFLELVISSKELTLKNDVFIIVLHVVEDSFIDFLNQYEILKATVPCTVHFMKVLNYFVLTNTDLNFDDDKFYTKKEIFKFINSTGPKPPDCNYIIKENFGLIPKIPTSQIITSNYRVLYKQKYFTQMHIVNPINDFSVTANNGVTNDYPIVNFMILVGVEDSEVGYIASAYDAGIINQALVIICYNDIDYTTGRPCTVIRKRLAVIYPKYFKNASIDFDPALFYTVKMDDSKSNSSRYLEFVYIHPSSKLDEQNIRRLAVERMFVVSSSTPKIGDSYSDVLGVVLNDVCEFQSGLYTFDNLSKVHTPKLEQWISTTNKYIRYLRPIDRAVLDGGSLKSDYKVFLIVNIVEPLHDFEKINLITQLMRASSQCCKYIIWNNSSPPTALQNINFTHKMGTLDSRKFEQTTFNYITPPIKDPQDLTLDSKKYKLSDNYYYLDATTRAGSREFSVDPQDKKYICFNNVRLGSKTNTTFESKIDYYKNMLYSNVKYNLWVCTTNEPIV